MFDAINRNMRLLSAILLGLTFVLTAALGGTAFSRRAQEETKNEALLCAALLEQIEDSDRVADALSQAGQARRITLIAPDGTVLYDNQADASHMKNHKNRPEIAEAMETGRGDSTRRSEVLDQVIYYYAVRLQDGSVCRIGAPQYQIAKLAATIALCLLLLTAALYVLATVLSYRLTDRIVCPLEQWQEDSPAQNVYPELRPFLQRISRQNRKIKQQMARIQGQKQQLQTISDAMKEGLAVLDEQGAVLTVNQSGLEWLEIAGDESESLEKICPVKEVRQCVFRARTGETLTKTFQRMGRSCRLYCSPVMADSKVNGIVLLMVDCSEEEKNEELRREFSANVSHELKTPLTSILGYAQLIARGMASGEQTRAFAEKIETESKRLIALIQDIMALSHLEEELPSESSPVSVRAVAQQALSRLEEQAKEKQVTLTLEGADFTVNGNSSRLEELVYNLCENGVKYNRVGGQVTVTLQSGQIRVADTGVGISPEDCRHIFERFYRVDKSRSKAAGGTGLGLSIVKHIAKNQNAEVTVTSTLGKGSCFTVTFLAQGDEPQK